MLEIFIPLEVKGFGFIQKLSGSFIKTIEKTYPELHREEFESRFFTGMLLSLDRFDYSLVALCNGEFGENYFLDYDVIHYTAIVSLGKQMLSKNIIEREIQKALEDTSGIIEILKSNTLLTFSKKKELLQRVQKSFFLLSSLAFTLYYLRGKSRENSRELETHSENGVGQAALLQETSIVKQAELDLSIAQFEGKVDVFIGVVSKIIK